MPKAESPKKRRPTVKTKAKNDPVHVAAARELRDRYLEQFNAGTLELGGKYAVCRRIEDGRGRHVRLLTDAA